MELHNVMKTIDFNTVLDDISELWAPQVVAKSDMHVFKVVKFEGEFTWHIHDEDKMLMVLDGSMRIDFKNEECVNLNKGDIYLVPKNMEHKPFSKTVCGILLIERNE